MRHFFDPALGGHALIFDGPLELIEAARDANRGANPFHKLKGFRWPGRQCDPGNWARAARYLTEPWPEAVAHIDYVVEYIKKQELPTPQSVKRKPRFTADDGEIDIDRWMGGDHEFFRQVKRTRLKNSMHVALVSNVEETDSWVMINSSGLYFRSMATIALCDVLEELGYTVEVWVWNRGLGVYPAPYDEQFLACKIKHAGDILDKDAMADAMAHWFGINAMWGAIAANPEQKPISVGHGIEADTNVNAFYNEDGTVNWYQYGIDYWVKYMDLEEDIQVYPIPFIVGNRESAANGAKQVLAKIVERQ